MSLYRVISFPGRPSGDDAEAAGDTEDEHVMSVSWPGDGGEDSEVTGN